MDGKHIEAEELTVRAFLKPRKRERFVQMLADPRRRRKALSELDHLSCIDGRFASQLPNFRHTAGAIYEELKSRGAPDSCHIISSDSALDQAKLNLKEALEKTVGYGMGTIICCIPGRLAYYEGEESSTRILLEWPDRLPK